MVNYLRSLTPRGRGVSHTSNGTTYEPVVQVAAGRVAAAAANALTLTPNPPAGWTDPGTPNRQYAFCAFGSLDGFIPDGIDTHVAFVDLTATASAERRIYLKATWDRPLTINLGVGLQPVWLTVELLASASAALNASVLPAHGAADPETGFREYYILPIGRVRWQQISGVWQRVLQSDDTGSIRSFLRTTYGGLVAAGGPDLPPTVAVNSDLVFQRNGSV